MNNLSVAYISSFAPRVCGIASFTRDLTEATGKIPQINSTAVIALNKGKKLDYGKEVVYSIDDASSLSFKNAAKFLNNSNYNVICLQHEYGLYGGEMGDLILDLIKNLKKPLITTFHMISSHPTPYQVHLTREISKKSNFVVPLSEYGKKDLINIYEIPKEKIRIILHGAPDIKFEKSIIAKKKLGLEKRKVLTSVNILRKSRGVDFVIKALPEIVKRFPEVIYLILGTDPDDSPKPNPYRTELENLVSRLKIKKHVKFENRYIPLGELIDYIKATDIFLTTYLPPEQSSSGSLAYAVVAGKVCISTPYSYAKLLLANGRGQIVPWKNSRAIAEKAVKLLSSPQKMEMVSKKAYLYGRKMIWENIAKDYFKLFCLAVNEGIKS